MGSSTGTGSKSSRRSSALRRVALALGLLASAPTLLATSDPTSGFETRVLAAHNRERSALDIPPLRWNPTLARDAATWGRHLVRVGRLVHYQEAPDDADPQGENLWAGTRRHYGLEAMVGLWIAEKKNFRAGVFPANSRTGDLEDVGHYTQLIWRSSGEVGCALVPGKRDDFLVCRYAEGGNVMGEMPF